MKKLLLHIPHSSTDIPINEGYSSTREKILQEIINLTDWYTDDLFDSDTDDKIIAPFSRIFCDVERFADDELEVMSKFGMGVLYEKFDDGETLRLVTSELRQEVINNYYWKHHNKFNDVVKNHLRETQSCLILDCHSFPSAPRVRAISQNPDRPDFNIGTDSFHTPKEIIEASIEYFESRRLSLGIDTPYSGSIVPMEYYHKDKRVASIMLEINRGLYLNDNSNEKSKGYNKTKEIVQGYMNILRSL